VLFHYSQNLLSHLRVDFAGTGCIAGMKVHCSDDSIYLHGFQAPVARQGRGDMLVAEVLANGAKLLGRPAMAHGDVEGSMPERVRMVVFEPGFGGPPLEDFSDRTGAFPEHRLDTDR